MFMDKADDMTNLFQYSLKLQVLTDVQVISEARIIGTLHAKSYEYWFRFLQIIYDLV